MRRVRYFSHDPRGLQAGKSKNIPVEKFLASHPTAPKQRYSVIGEKDLTRNNRMGDHEKKKEEQFEKRFSALCM